MAIDRTAAATAMAKAIAHKNSGNDALANQWARKLVELLECADILERETA